MNLVVAAKETVYESMDVFGCLAVPVSNIVKQRKSKFLHKFMLLEKGADLYGQFVSVAERELAALRYCGIFGYTYVLVSLFIVFFICYHIFGE